jgi:regulatory protein
VAVRLLAGREHSIGELREKLRVRGYPEAAVDATLRSLAERDLLSESRFVESFVRVRAERGQGPMRIRAELRERGIDDERIDAAITRPAEFWLERLEHARAKRFGEAGPASGAEWNRQARFLAQRGFPSDLIYRALGR